jgi:hypothetical protein
MTEGNIIQFMYKWNGSGKYDRLQFDRLFGSAASRVQILQNLQNMNFLTSINKKISITSKGQEFLSYPCVKPRPLGRGCKHDKPLVCII